ncbi:MAG: TRAM domain-containing protein [Elusimicrobiota bacterium]
MKILFVLFGLIFFGVEVYTYKTYGSGGLIFSIIASTMIFLASESAKALGFEKCIFKTIKKDIKILDESSIIDGRIIDIIKSRFLSGTLIVPKFVMEHLQKLSNSENQIEKAKGRRGLDVIARLGENEILPFKILSQNYEEENIDQKIVKLAKDMKASIITTEFSMTKNGTIENVPVLNINDLSLALKPIILPGEEMNIFIMKEGKERNQGVGYLDDGTMVVVEDGHQYIGRKVDVRVQSILQNPNGRIIFSKIKINER